MKNEKIKSLFLLTSLQPGRLSFLLAPKLKHLSLDETTDFMFMCCIPKTVVFSFKESCFNLGEKKTAESAQLCFGIADEAFLL